MKSLTERKAEIPYDKIDMGYRKIIKLLNKFPFCITTSCCQGHADLIGGETYTANGYITLEVTDEQKFLDLLKGITPSFYNTTELQLNVSKEYHFNAEGEGNYYHWRLSYWWGRDTETAKREVEDKMKQGRKCLEKLLQEYQQRNKDVLDG